MIKDVSPAQGHAPLAPSRVTRSPAPSPTGSMKTLFSQFRGPFVYNETDEERRKREEEEQKKKDDEQKQSNFRKVQEAREAAEARVKQLEEEKSQREEADRKAADAKLTEEKKFEELAKAKEAEAAAKGAEADAERKRADDLAAKVKAFEDQQEAELTELLKTIPDDKKPPLDQSDPVSKRIQQAKYAASLLGTKKPDPINGPPRKQGDQTKEDRLAELKKKGYGRMTADEAMELAELSE